MSDKAKEAIEAREKLTRGEPDTYHDVQAKAKDRGIPANQSRDDLEKAIEESDGAEGDTGTPA